MATSLGTSILYKGKFYLDGEDLGARDVQLTIQNDNLTVILKGANGDPINEGSESATVALPFGNPIISGSIDTNNNKIILTKRDNTEVEIQLPAQTVVAIDSTIVENSTNAVSGGAVYDAIEGINTILGDINTALEGML